MNKFKKATKKIAAVGVAAAYAATAALAGGLTSYPDNFVDSNKFNGKIIIGENSDDAAAASLVIDNLKKRFSGNEERVQLTVKKTTEAGKSVEIIDKNTHLYVGGDFADVITDFDDSDFPKFLADGIVKDEDNEDKEYDYEQKIILSSDIKAAFGRNVGDLDDKTDMPVPFVDLSDANGELYTLEIDFKDTINNVAKTSTDGEGLVDSEKITMFGTDFTFDPKTDNDENLKLYSSSTTVVLDSESTTKTVVEYEGKTYEVEMLGANSNTNKVQLRVNGKSDTVTEGNTATIGGLKVYVEDVFVNDLNNDLKTASARLFLGSNEIEIPTDARGTASSNWVEIEVDGEALDGYFVRADVGSNTSTWDGLTKLEFKFIPKDLENEIEYLMAGESVQDPLFKQLSVSFDGMKEDLKSDDKTEFIAGNEHAYVEFVNVEGNKYKLPVFTGMEEGVTAAVAEVSTITLVGDPSADGDYSFTLDGTTHIVPLISTDTITTAAAKIATYIGADDVTGLSDYTATSAAGVVTITALVPGVQADTTTVSLGTTGITSATAATTTQGADAAYDGTDGTAVTLYNDEGAVDGNGLNEVKKLVASGNKVYKKNMFILNSYEVSNMEDEVTGVYEITGFTKEKVSTGVYDQKVKIKNVVTGNTYELENGDELEDTRVYIQGLREDVTLSNSIELDTTKEGGTGIDLEDEAYIITSTGQKLTVVPASFKITVEELNIDDRESISAVTDIFDVTYESETGEENTELSIASLDGSNTISENDDGSDNAYYLTKTGTYVIEDIDSESTSIEMYTPKEENPFRVMFNIGKSGSTSTMTVLSSELEAKKAELKEDGYEIISEKKLEASAPVTFDVSSAVMASEGMEVMDAIVVGGPAVNAAARTLLGIDVWNPATEKVTEGNAVIRYFEDEKSVLIYGWSKADTIAGVEQLNTGSLENDEIVNVAK